MNKTICYKKNSLSPKNSSILEGFSHLKFSYNATSHKLVVCKHVTLNTFIQYLVLQNCFESLSCD